MITQADLVAIITAPYVLGAVWPQVELIGVLLALKLFDWWSTTYILKHKGKETMSMSRTLIERFGLQIGIALDFAIVGVAAWFCYPYEYILLAVVAWYAYWMFFQITEVKKSMPK